MQWVKILILSLFLASCGLLNSRNKAAAPNQVQAPTQMPKGEERIPLKAVTQVERKKFGIVVAVHDRPHFLQTTLFSLVRSNLSQANVVLIDDFSPSKRVIQTLNQFQLEGIPTSKIGFKENQGVLNALITGFDLLENQVDFIVNIDADVLLSREWLAKLETLYHRLAQEDTILTGFNTKNHETLYCVDTFCAKKDIGGINFFFSSAFYKRHLKQWLHAIPKAQWKQWDWIICRQMTKHKFTFFSTKPSVIQHIGAAGMNSLHSEIFDWADDFEFYKQ